jgi:hypothetical protein
MVSCGCDGHCWPLEAGGVIFFLGKIAHTCFFQKRDSTASWVADAIWQQHFEENLALNPNFCKF